MSKIMMMIGEAALLAVAVVLMVVPGGQLFGAMLLNVELSTIISIGATLATMSAGMLISSISAATAGGVTSSMSIKNSVGNRQTVYGQTRVSGTVIYMSSIAYTINQIVAWASHQCEQVQYVYLDGREVFITGHGHNAVAGAEGFCDEWDHYDQSGNKYNFRASSGNYHVYTQSTLGTPTGKQLAITNGWGSPSGDGLVRKDTNWPATSTLNGICATLVCASSNADMFNNIPQIKASVKGKNDIYDPRLGPLNSDFTKPAAYCRWTCNAALIIADFLADSNCGLAYTWDEIDIPQLIAAANICDEQVPLSLSILGPWAANFNYSVGQTVIDSNGRQQTVSGITQTYDFTMGGVVTNVAHSGNSHPVWSTTLGGSTIDRDITWTAGIMGVQASESRYTINGTVDWAASPGDTLSQMLEACAGRISIWNGKIKVYPGVWQGLSGVSYGLGDLVSGIKGIKQKKYRDMCNTVRAKYICPSYPYSIQGYDKNHKDNNVFDGQFQPTDAPQYAQDAGHGYVSDANLAADAGIPLIQDRSFNFVQSVGQAQRLMKIYLLRTRQKTSLTIRVNAKGLQNVPNDVVNLTIPNMGWNNKLFEITELRHVPQIEVGKPPMIAWEFELQETDPSIYVWSIAEERTVINTPSPHLLDNLQVSPVSGIVLSAALADCVVSPDGLVTPRLNVNWTQPDDPFTLSGGSIVIQYQKAGASAWTQYAIATGVTTQCYITGVIAGLSYNVQIKAMHAGGASSVWSQAGPYTIDYNLSNIDATTLGGLSATEILAEIQAATDAAAAATASALAATTALNIISSDSYLSKGEKPAVTLLWTNILSEKAGIDASADAVAADRSGYDTAYNALNTYLTTSYAAGGVGTGAGDWSNVLTNSQIVGATWSAKWSAYYTAKQALLNTIVALTKALTFNTITLANPNFEAGNTGWNHQAGWSISQNGHAAAGTWSAVKTAAGGTSATTNSVWVPCTPGMVFSAQCMALASGSPNGYLAVRCNFFDVNHAVITSNEGNKITAANTTWTLSKATFVAPSSPVTAFVQLDIAVYNITTGAYYVDSCALTDVTQNTSTGLLGQGSILPNQPIALSYTTTTSSITINIAAQSLLRTDGSSFSVLAGSKVYTGLAASTIYYFYAYISLADGKLYFCNPTPPQTVGNSLYKIQTSLDGRLPISEQQYTTASATGGGGTGGGSGGDPVCPESEELVTEQTKGVIKVKDVKVGDFLKGRCFATGEDTYRRVIQITSAPAAVWRMVDGHRVSPCEPIWHEGAWKPSYKASGSTIDHYNGLRINLSLDNDEFDEQNYYLSEGTPLLIHNFLKAAC